MSVVTLRDSLSGSSAQVSVDRGFNCFAFQAVVADQIVDVLDTEAGFEAGVGRPSGNGIPLLFPYPNRIKGGRYSWDGKDYVISPELAGYDRTGNAIHGFCIDRLWRVLEQTESSVLGEFQLSRDAAERRPLWPADCILRLRYTVSGAKLRAEIEVHNPDTVPLPWGFGTHPYFKLPLGKTSRPDQCLLVAPVRDCWDLTDCLPSGTKLPLPEDVELSDGQYFGLRRFDDVFSVIPSPVIECSIIDEAAGLQVKQSHPGHYPELVIYTPPNRDSICFEPYTCVTDAINLETQGLATGWQALAPGASFRSWIDIEAGLVVA